MANGGTGAAFFDAVRKVEQMRGTRLWCIIHGSENAHICYPALWSVLEERSNIGRGDTIELFVHSPGGHPEVAYQIMKFFRGRFKKVNMIVPLSAKSAATVMCLGADKIFLGELAELGPIDIQLNDAVEHGQKPFSPLDEFKSLEYMRDLAGEWMTYHAEYINAIHGISIKDALKDSVSLVTGLMRPLFEQIDPVEMGGYRRAIAIGEEYAKRMLAVMQHPNAKAIVERLVWGYPAHSFCIDQDEAEELGLPVERLPEEQDAILAEAVISIERGVYHGFVPAPPAAKATTSPSRPMRSFRRPKAPKAAQSGRPNGSGGTSEGQRSSASKANG